MARKHKKLQISIVDGSKPDPSTKLLAVRIDRIAGSMGAVLICGGLAGVLETAARGAKEKGGLTIGLLPSYKKQSANPFIDIVLPTGLGHARNILVAAAGDILIALPGSHGTRSEISSALLLGKSVLGYRSWGEIPQVVKINSLKELKSRLHNI